MDCPALEICVLGKCECGGVSRFRNATTGRCDENGPTCPASPVNDPRLGVVKCPEWSSCSMPLGANSTAATNSSGMASSWRPCTCMEGYTLVGSGCAAVTVAGDHVVSNHSSSSDGSADVFLVAPGQGVSPTGHRPVRLEFAPFFSADPDDSLVVQQGCAVTDPVVAQFQSAPHNTTVPSIAGPALRGVVIVQAPCVRVTYHAPRGKVPRGPYTKGFEFRALAQPENAGAPPCVTTVVGDPAAMQFHVDLELNYTSDHAAACRDYVFSPAKAMAVSNLRVNMRNMWLVRGAVLILMTPAVPNSIPGPSSVAGDWTVTHILAEDDGHLPPYRTLTVEGRAIKVRVLLSGQARLASGVSVSNTPRLASVAIDATVPVMATSVGDKAGQKEVSTNGTIACEYRLAFPPALARTWQPSVFATERRRDTSCENDLCAEYHFPLDPRSTSSLRVLLDLNATISQLLFNETLSFYRLAPAANRLALAASNGTTAAAAPFTNTFPGLYGANATDLATRGVEHLLTVSGANASASALAATQGLVIEGYGVAVVHRQRGAAGATPTPPGNASALCDSSSSADVANRPANPIPGPRLVLQAVAPYVAGPLAPGATLTSRTVIEASAVDLPSLEVSVPSVRYDVFSPTRQATSFKPYEYHLHVFEISNSSTVNPVRGVRVTFHRLPVREDDDSSVFLYPGSAGLAHGNLIAEFRSATTLPRALAHLAANSSVANPSEYLLGRPGDLNRTTGGAEPPPGSLNTVVGSDGTVYQYRVDNAPAPAQPSANATNATAPLVAILPPLEVLGVTTVSILLATGGTRSLLGGTETLTGFLATVEGIPLYSPLPAQPAGTCNRTETLFVGVKVGVNMTGNITNNATATNTTLPPCDLLAAANGGVIPAGAQCTNITASSNSSGSSAAAAAAAAAAAMPVRQAVVSFGRYGPGWCREWVVDAREASASAAPSAKGQMALDLAFLRLDTEPGIDTVVVTAWDPRGSGTCDAVYAPAPDARDRLGVFSGRPSPSELPKVRSRFPCIGVLFNASAAVHGLGFDLEVTVSPTVRASDVAELCDLGSLRSSVPSERSGIVQHEAGTSAKDCREFAVPFLPPATSTSSPAAPSPAAAAPTFIEFPSFVLAPGDSIALYRLTNSSADGSTVGRAERNPALVIDAQRSGAAGNSTHPPARFEVDLGPHGFVLLFLAGSAASQKSSSFAMAYWTPNPASGCVEKALYGSEATFAPFPGTPFPTLRNFCQRWVVAPGLFDETSGTQAVQFNGFTAFSLTNDEDRVVLFDVARPVLGLAGSDVDPVLLSAARIIDVAGFQSPEGLAVLRRASGRGFIAEFTSGSGAGGPGFTASYTHLLAAPPVGVVSPDPPGNPIQCDSVLAYTGLDAASQSTPTPTYPNSACLEYYVAPPNARAGNWVLSFDYFSTQTGRDVATLYTEDGARLASYSGASLSIDPIFVNGSAITIVFTTDVSGTDLGFQFSWRVLSDAELSDTGDLRLTATTLDLAATAADEGAAVAVLGLPGVFAASPASAATTCTLTITAVLTETQVPLSLFANASLAGVTPGSPLTDAAGASLSPVAAISVATLRSSAVTSLVLSGSTAAVNAAVKDVGAVFADKDACGAVELTVSLTVGLTGEPPSKASYAVARGTFVFACVNDPPTLSVLSSLQVRAGSTPVDTLVLSLGDPDSPSGDMAITLSVGVSAGYLTLGSSAVVSAANAPTRTSIYGGELVLSGNLADILAALRAGILTYSYPREHCWAASVPLAGLVSISDLGNRGKPESVLYGFVRLALTTFTLTVDCSAVNPLPAPPLLVVPSVDHLLPRGTLAVTVAVAVRDPAPDASSTFTVRCVVDKPSVALLNITAGGLNSSASATGGSSNSSSSSSSAGLTAATLVLSDAPLAPPGGLLLIAQPPGADVSGASVLVTCSVDLTTGRFNPDLLPPTRVLLPVAPTALQASKESVRTFTDPSTPALFTLSLTHPPLSQLEVACTPSVAGVFADASALALFSPSVTSAPLSFTPTGSPGVGSLACSVTRGVGTGWTGNETLSIAFAVTPAAMTVTGPRGRFSVDYEFPGLASSAFVTLSSPVGIGQTANIMCRSANKSVVLLDETRLFSPSRSEPTSVLVPFITVANATGFSLISCACVSGSPLFLGSAGEVEIALVANASSLTIAMPSVLVVGRETSITVQLPVLPPSMRFGGNLSLAISVPCAPAGALTLSDTTLVFGDSHETAVSANISILIAEPLKGPCELVIASSTLADLRIKPAAAAFTTKLRVFGEAGVVLTPSSSPSSSSSSSSSPASPPPPDAVAGPWVDASLEVWAEGSYSVWVSPNAEIAAVASSPALPSSTTRSLAFEIGAASAIPTTLMFRARPLEPGSSGSWNLHAAPTSVPALAGDPSALAAHMLGVSRRVAEPVCPLDCSGAGACIRDGVCDCGPGSKPDCSACADGFEGKPPACTPAGRENPPCPTGFATSAATGLCSFAGSSGLLIGPSSSPFIVADTSAAICVPVRLNPALASMGVIPARPAAEAPAVSFQWTVSVDTPLPAGVTFRPSSLPRTRCSPDEGPGLSNAVPALLFDAIPPSANGAAIRMVLQATVPGVISASYAVQVQLVAAPQAPPLFAPLRVLAVDDRGSPIPIFSLRFDMPVVVNLTTADPALWYEFLVGDDPSAFSSGGEALVGRPAERGVAHWETMAYIVVGKFFMARACTLRGAGCVASSVTSFTASLGTALADEPVASSATLPGSSTRQGLLATLAVASAARPSSALSAADVAALDWASLTLLRVETSALLEAQAPSGGRGLPLSSAAASFAFSITAISRASSRLSPGGLLDVRVATSRALSLLEAAVSTGSAGPSPREDEAALASAARAHRAAECVSKAQTDRSIVTARDLLAAAVGVARRSPSQAGSVRGVVWARIVDAEDLLFDQRAVSVASGFADAGSSVSAYLMSDLVHPYSPRGSAVASAIASLCAPLGVTRGLGSPVYSPLAVAIDVRAEPASGEALAFVRNSASKRASVMVMLLHPQGPPRPSMALRMLSRNGTAWESGAQGGPVGVEGPFYSVPVTLARDAFYAVTPRCTDPAANFSSRGLAHETTFACACEAGFNQLEPTDPEGLYCQPHSQPWCPALTPSSSPAKNTSVAATSYLSYSGDVVVSVTSPGEAGALFSEVSLVPVTESVSGPSRAGPCVYPSLAPAGTNGSSIWRRECETYRASVSPVRLSSECGISPAPAPGSLEGELVWRRGALKIRRRDLPSERRDLLVESPGSAVRPAPGMAAANVTTTPSTLAPQIVQGSSAVLAGLRTLPSNGSLVELTWFVTLLGPVAISSLPDLAAAITVTFTPSALPALPRSGFLTLIEAVEGGCDVFDPAMPCTIKISYAVPASATCSVAGSHVVTGLPLICRGLFSGTGSPACPPGVGTVGSLSLAHGSVAHQPVSLCSTAYISSRAAFALAVEVTGALSQLTSGNGTEAEASTTVAGAVVLENTAGATDGMIRAVAFAGPDASSFRVANLDAVLSAVVAPRSRGKVAIDLTFSPMRSGMHQATMVVTTSDDPFGASGATSTVEVPVAGLASPGPPPAPSPVTLELQPHPSNTNASCRYANGSTILVRYAAPLRDPPAVQTAADLAASQFAFSPDSLAALYSARWSADNTTLVVTLVDVGASRQCADSSMLGVLTVSSPASVRYVSTPQTARFSRLPTRSPALSPAVPVTLLSFEARDPGDRDRCLSVGDELILGFSLPTDAPRANQPFVFAGFPAETRFSNPTWNVDGTKATVNITSAAPNCSRVVGVASVISASVRDRSGTGPSVASLPALLPLAGSVGRPSSLIRLLVQVPELPPPPQQQQQQLRVFTLIFSSPPYAGWLPAPPNITASHLTSSVISLSPANISYALNGSSWSSDSTQLSLTLSGANWTSVNASSFRVTVLTTSPADPAFEAVSPARATSPAAELVIPQPSSTPTPAATPTPSETPTSSVPAPLILSDIIAEHRTKYAPSAGGVGRKSLQASSGNVITSSAADPTTRLLTGDGLLFMLDTPALRANVRAVYNKSVLDEKILVRPSYAADAVGFWATNQLFVILIRRALPPSSSPRPSELRFPSITFPEYSNPVNLSVALQELVMSGKPVVAATSQHYDGSYNPETGTPGYYIVKPDLSGPVASSRGWSSRNWWAVLLIILACVAAMAALGYAATKARKRAGKGAHGELQEERDHQGLNGTKPEEGGDADADAATPGAEMLQSGLTPRPMPPPPSLTRTPAKAKPAAVSYKDQYPDVTLEQILKAAGMAAEIPGTSEADLKKLDDEMEGQNGGREGALDTSSVDQELELRSPPHGAPAPLPPLLLSSSKKRGLPSLPGSSSAATGSATSLPRVAPPPRGPVTWRLRPNITAGEGARPTDFVPDEVIAQLTALFKEIDVNADGHVDPDEYRAYAESRDLPVPNRAWFDLADADNDGRVSCQEFIEVLCLDYLVSEGGDSALLRLFTGKELRACRTTFKKFDLDESGSLTKDETLEALKILHPEQTATSKTAHEAVLKMVADDLFRSADRDGDGKVTWSEFVAAQAKLVVAGRIKQSM